MKSQQLRNSILQLAIEGKLVPQNIEDTNIQETLKELDNTKKDLGNSIKLPKQYDSGLEDKPHEIPQNWKWVKLRELSRKITDGVHKTPRYTNEGIPFLSVKNISSGFLSFEETRFVSIEDHKKMIERCNPEQGDILFCRIGTLGKPVVIETNKEFSIFVSVGLIKLLDNRMSNFIKIVMESPMFKKQINQVKVDGSHTSKINLRDVPNFWIPLPPLEEQQRILNEVEKLSIKIYEYGKLEEKLTSLNSTFPIKMEKSILQYAIEGKLVKQDINDGNANDLIQKITQHKASLLKNNEIRKGKETLPINEIPFNIPDNWAWVRLGDLGYCQTGTTPKKSIPEFFNGEIPFIKPKDISNDGINYDNESLTKLGLDQGRTIPESSILMVCIGSIGKCYFTDRLVSCNQQINAITPYYTDIKYLYFCLISPYFQNKAWEESSSTTLSILNRTKWENLLIPLPPLPEQKRIVNKIEEYLLNTRKLKQLIN